MKTTFFSRLFQSGKPKKVETLEELFTTCISMGGQMFAASEDGQVFYIEKVEEGENHG